MKIKINTPDGKSLLLNVPDGSDEATIQSYAQKAKDDYAGGAQKPGFLDQVKTGYNAIKTLNDETGFFPGPGSIDHMAMKAGTKIAETDIGDPTARGLVAGTVANAPDLAVAGEGLRNAGAAGLRLAGKAKKFFTRPSPKELREAMQVELKGLGTPATDAAKAKAAQAVAPVQQKVRSAKEAAEQVSGRFREVEAAAEARLKQAKGGLDVAESRAAIDNIPATDPRLVKITKNSEDMARWTSRAKRIADEGPIAVSKRLKPQRIQLYRKVLQEGRRALSGKARADLEGARESMSRSLEYGDDFFKEAREEYQAAKTVVDGLPTERTKAVEAARKTVAEAGRELQSVSQKFRALTDEARTADKARRTAIEVERRRLIQEAESFETKLRRGYTLAKAAGWVAGGLGIGYGARRIGGR